MMNSEHHPSWVKRWLFTTYHKDIGLLYLVTSLYFAFVGGLLAMTMRVQLSVPSNSFLQADAYNAAVTMHGLIMILWFLSPLGVAFANYIVPLQIGADDLAFPRLNALSYWLYLVSGLMAVAAFVVPGGAFNGGWTAYAPLSSAQYTPGPGPTLTFTGFVLLCVSITVGSINFITTILSKRAPGMTWSKLPIFTWFTLFTQILMLVAFPSILAGLIELISGRVLNMSYLSASAGGALLWDNLFWFFGHPEVYVVLLPAFGAILEILAVFTGRPLSGRNAIIVAAGFLVVPLSIFVWGHHMFVTGIPAVEREAFTATTFAISVPFDVMVLSMIHTLAGGRIRLKTPMLFALGAIIVFIIGGITGVMLASFIVDIALRGTYFVVAHFHYVMAGATIFGLYAATYYWLPKMTGHMYSERLGKLHFVLSFISFNVLYFPMYFLYDMPRRIFTYSAGTGWGSLNMIASVGGIVFALAQIPFLVNILIAVYGRIPSVANPWGAVTPEWKPLALGPIGGLPKTESGGASSAHEQTMSQRPITLAIGGAVTLTGLALLQIGVGVPFMLAGLFLVAWAVIGWAMDDLRGSFKVPEDGPGEKWPAAHVSKVKLGVWTFLSSEVLVFGSLLASYVYIRAYTGADWPAPGTIHPVMVGAVNTMVLLTSSLTALLALRAARAGDKRQILIWMGLTFVLGTAFLVIKGLEWSDLLFLTSYLSPALSKPFTPSSGLPGSTYYLTVGLHAAHVFGGLMVMLYIIRRTLAGKVTKENHRVVELFGLYWAFVDIVWIFVFPLFYLV
ncbi:MAG: cbb3-type cytochrome c oxidase subunit I [Nitrososphaerota archaeon]|nr:cbb3-type cytochrome c oxidase subunit I [Nitrososphaerota archaeon]